jgi:hypothetical protein
MRMMAGALYAQRRAVLERDLIAFHDSFAGKLGSTVRRGRFVTVGTRR